MTLYLVRHAVALPKGAWPGSDIDRPLDAKGSRQVVGLTTWFALRPVDVVLTSPAVRCVTTVLPVANDHGVDLVTRRALLPGTLSEAGAFVADLRREARTQARAIVVCTHGEVLPAILEALGHKSSEPLRSAKGSVWTLEEADGSPTFDYDVPLAVDDAG